MANIKKNEYFEKKSVENYHFLLNYEKYINGDIFYFIGKCEDCDEIEEFFHTEMDKVECSRCRKEIIFDEELME
jgi:hypothetical protein